MKTNLISWFRSRDHGPYAPINDPIKPGDRVVIKNKYVGKSEKICSKSQRIYALFLCIFVAQRGFALKVTKLTGNLISNREMNWSLVRHPRFRPDALWSQLEITYYTEKIIRFSDVVPLNHPVSGLGKIRDWQRINWFETVESFFPILFRIMNQETPFF